MDDRERIEVEETEVVETTDVDTTNETDMDVTPGTDVDGGEDPAVASSQTEDGKTILGPEDDMDREITNPDGMPAPADLNVDKQINDENTGFMDELGKKFETGVAGDAEKEGIHDENVESIINEIDKAMAIQHADNNAEKDPNDPSHETLGGVDITENRENAAAIALQERADANAKTEYTATGEPKELGEYMKEQHDMEDGNDLFGEGNDNHEVVNDKVKVMPSTFDNSDSNVEGSVIPEGETDEVPEDNGNTSELEANGDSENRSFEAGNSLTATEDEDENFVPDADEEESEEDSDNEEYDSEEDDEDDDEDEEFDDDSEDSDDFGGDSEDDETSYSNDDESFGEDSENDGCIKVTIAPGTDKEIRSLDDLGETQKDVELVTPEGLLDQNKEVSDVNTNVNTTDENDYSEGENTEVTPSEDFDSDGEAPEEEFREEDGTEDEEPQMPGNNGNDMVSGSNYDNAGELDEHKDLADIVREMDDFDAGMGIGDDAQNPTQFGDNAVNSEEMGDGQSYVGGDAFDRDACCDGDGADNEYPEEEYNEEYNDESEPVETEDNSEDIEGTESIYSKNFSPWNW